MVAAPSSPSLVDDPADLPVEVYPDSEEGRRLRARHRVMRRLLDDPVVHYDDLDDREADWLTHALGFVHELLERDVGLVVERRAEGLLAVDPARELTDETFPDGGSTVKHAALLLAELFTDRARERHVAAGRGRARSWRDAEVVRPGRRAARGLRPALRLGRPLPRRRRHGTGRGRARAAGTVRPGRRCRRAAGEPRPAIARFAPQAVGARTRRAGAAPRGDARRRGQLDLLGGTT